MAVWIILMFFTWIPGISQGFKCDLLYLKVDNDNLPHKMLEGVYAKTCDGQFKNQYADNTYLDLQPKQLKWEVSVGPLNQDPLFTGTVGGKDIQRLKTGSKSMVRHIGWRRNDSFINWKTMNHTVLKCVDETFLPCSSDSFTFNNVVHLQSSTGEPIRMEKLLLFSRMKFNMNLRPVYQMSGPNFVLYFEKGVWTVRETIGSHVLMRCDDSSLRPEHLMCSWQVFWEGEFREKYKTSLQCGGNQPSGKQSLISLPTQHDPCKNCLQSGTKNESPSQVICRYRNASGRRNTNASKPECEDLSSHGFDPLLYQQGYLIDDHSTYMCGEGKNFIHAVCEIENGFGEWKFQGKCEEDMFMKNRIKRWDNGPIIRIPRSNRDRIRELNYLNAAYGATFYFIVGLLIFKGPFLVYTITQCHYACKFFRVNKISFIGTLRGQNKIQQAFQNIKNVFDKMDVERKACLKQHLGEQFKDTPVVDYPPELTESLNEINTRYYPELVEADKALEEMSLPDPTVINKQSASCIPIDFMVISIIHFFFTWFIISMLIGCSAAGCLVRNALIASIIFLVLMPIYLVIEMCMSKDRKYLIASHAHDSNSFIKSVRKEEPVIEMVAAGFSNIGDIHETQEEGGKEYIVNGQRIAVESKKMDNEFRYWVDDSEASIANLSPTKVTRVERSCDITFGDDESRMAFQAAFQKFKQDTRYLAPYVQYAIRKTTGGLQKHVLIYPEGTSLPIWMKTSWFWITGLLCCTWPYRLAFRLATARGTHSTRKRVYVNPPPDLTPEQYNVVDKHQETTVTN